VTVSANYFDLMGMRLLQGRSFMASDTGGGDQALIVSESWAKHYSPDRPVIGRRVFEGGCTAESCPPTYIVGVVSDVKYQGLSANGEAAYWPSTLVMFRSGVLMVRTQGPTEAVLPQVRARLMALDRGVPIDEMDTMESHVFGTIAAPRHWAMLLAGFALVSLALAAIGTFGLLSYLVTMMWREIGVRVALGAQRGEIARLIVGRGLTQSVVGIVAGLAIAFAGRKVLAASLYEVEAGDPMTLAGVAVILLAVAALASWIPARRAARIDPMTAIRSD
jgi:putative ABC transport system permease protein